MIATAMSSTAGTAVIPMQDWLGLGREARMNPVHPWRQLEMAPDGRTADGCTGGTYEGRDRDLLQVICPDEQEIPESCSSPGFRLLTVNTYILCLIL